MSKWREYTNVNDCTACLLDAVRRGYTVKGMDIDPVRKIVRVFVESWL